MSKRKCVQRAIIEISDDSETESDCVLKQSSPESLKKSKYSHSEASRRDNIRDDARVDRVQTYDSTIARSTNKGESPAKVKKTKGSRVKREISSSIKEENETGTSDHKRRKIPETNPKMGLFGSKTATKKKELTNKRHRKKSQDSTQSGSSQRKQQIKQASQNLPQCHIEVKEALLMQQKSCKVEALVSSYSSQMEDSTMAKPKPDDTADSYLTRLKGSNIRCSDWSVIDYIRDYHFMSPYVAENVVQLFKEDNTIPFIARYRRDQTQGMDADQLRSIKNCIDKANLIKQRAASIIKEIDKQGKWTPEFHAFVIGTKSLSDLDHIHSMFKVVKSTLVERAKIVGLADPAERIINGRMCPDLVHYVDLNTEGLKTVDDIQSGIVCIVADMIYKDQRTFDKIKTLRLEIPMQIQSTKVKGAEKKAEEPKVYDKHKKVNEEDKYDLYYNFQAREDYMKPYQILAINRGEARKVLNVKVIVSNQFEQEFENHCFEQYRKIVVSSPLHRKIITAAIKHVFAKSVKPSVRRRTRQEMNERAEIASMDVFAENVKQLLLTPPVRGKVVVGVDPGFRHGCKLAVVSEQGDMLETETIYPHDTAGAKYNAERVLAKLVLRHRCTVLALGNGTACRETEVFLVQMIKNKAFEPLDVVYTIVDETGASIYSCSNEASAEFPNLDVNVISAVSIARRLQDPMAELVKIEPKHLGVGMYQHDLPEKPLAAKLNEIIMEAVSFVGVDVNTASVSLLKRVAGLGDSKAKNIIEYRKISGPFRTRNDLLKVKNIGNKTFEQCAGFIRIMPETAVQSNRSRGSQDPFNYLDQTWIHPESYEVAKCFIKAAGCNLSDIGTKSFISAVNTFAAREGKNLAKLFGTTQETIDVIIKGLSMKKGEDIRAKSDITMFRKSLTSIDDLSIGTTLTGVVRNITHFGAFVDVGVERSGLIHTTCMSGISLSVGERVEAKVNRIDKERGRLGLTLIRQV